MLQGIAKEDDWSLEWSLTLAEYIRNNDQPLMEAGDKLLDFFQEEVLPCTSFSEFCDVMSLYQEIPDPDDFLQKALNF